MRKNNKENVSEISITMNIGASAAADGNDETRRQKNDPGKSTCRDGCNGSSRCLCGGRIDTAAIVIPADGDKERRVYIEACPSHYEVWEVDGDGTETMLFGGKRGSVYKVMQKVNEGAKRRRQHHRGRRGKRG